jgi:hypothetical protein
LLACGLKTLDDFAIHLRGTVERCLMLAFICKPNLEFGTLW